MKRLRKLISVVCILSVLLLCLAGCSSSNPNEGKGNSSDSPALQETGQQESNDVNTGKYPVGEDPAAVDSTEQPSTENQAGNQNTEPVSSTDEQPAEGQKVLVAYFSATGTTKALAEYAADALGADLYEIVPEEPYISEDLNYNDSKSRSSIEMDDPSARPAILGGVEDMGQYDIVFWAIRTGGRLFPCRLHRFWKNTIFRERRLSRSVRMAGGWFGQSLTAIAKLVPDAVMGEALSVHYSGGSSLGSDVAEWLEVNGILEE